ncbi:MAG: heme o synthase [Pseudonocardiaceae bacterium]
MTRSGAYSHLASGLAARVALAPVRTIVIDCVRLTKPRIISLLLFTALCALFAGARAAVPWPVLLAVAGGGYLASGGANALNCAADGDLDELMSRTRNRPVPQGRVSPTGAAVFGLLLNALAGWWLWTEVGPAAAVLALAGTAWYVLVYTLWLKRRSTQNIVIGGAAGCFPALVGWAAGTGRLDATAVALAAVVFFWTPPHFWSLAVLLKDDYQRAGVPMLPAVAGARETAAKILRYAVATLVVSLLPVLWGGLGVPFAVVAAAMGGRFVQLSAAYRAHPGTKPAARLFHFSLLYLAVIFLAAAIDRIINVRLGYGLW